MTHPVIEAVRYGFSKDPWYARVTWPDGRTYHEGPWATEWAAERCVELMRGAWYRNMAKQGEVGNGETCPLFPEHGNMYVLNTEGQPPRQYCSHADHDGRGRGDDAIPRSRSLWPVYGFRESVEAYTARLDRAIREAGLPDLSDLEVK